MLAKTFLIFKVKKKKKGGVCLKLKLDNGKLAIIRKSCH